MDRHLSDEEVFDAFDGSLEGDRLTHLAACRLCADRVQELRATVAHLRDVEVPEPSPIFWERLSARIGDAIRLPDVTIRRSPAGGEDAAQGLALSWRRFWRFAVPCGAAVAALVLSLVVAAPPRTTVPSAGEANQTGADDLGTVADASVESSDVFNLVASMLTDGDGELGGGIASVELFEDGGAVDSAIAALSDDERRDLADALKLALEGRGV
jgi:hypothetical protein